MASVERRWVANLLEMSESYDSSQEFIESVKTDIFPDEIYVFTPQGKIIEMSAGKQEFLVSETQRNYLVIL